MHTVGVTSKICDASLSPPKCVIHFTVSVFLRQIHFFSSLHSRPHAVVLLEFTTLKDNNKKHISLA